MDCLLYMFGNISQFSLIFLALFFIAKLYKRTRSLDNEVKMLTDMFVGLEKQVSEIKPTKEQKIKSPPITTERARVRKQYRKKKS